MSETLNVNVLVAAKEEYSKQLINCIQGGIYNIIHSIYNDSQKNNIRLTVFYSNFQRELKMVPNWADYKLEEKVQSINRQFPYLMDLITAIFVSHVKILACVRLKSDDKSVKIKVPSLNSFLHKIIIHSCEQIYYNPHSINDEKNKMLILIHESITETIANQIPIEYILNEYLSGAFDEPEQKYPDTNNIIDDFEQSGDNDEVSDDDEEYKNENKDIPIIPISKPIHRRNVEAMIQNTNSNNDTPDVGKESNEEENPIQKIDELQNLENEEITVNKKYEISDDEDSDDDEDSEGEEPNKVKENTLF